MTTFLQVEVHWKICQWELAIGVWSGSPFLGYLYGRDYLVDRWHWPGGGKGSPRVMPVQGRPPDVFTCGAVMWAGCRSQLAVRALQPFLEMLAQGLSPVVTSTTRPFPVARHSNPLGTFWAPARPNDEHVRGRSQPTGRVRRPSAGGAGAEGSSSPSPRGANRVGTSTRSREKEHQGERRRATGRSVVLWTVDTSTHTETDRDRETHREIQNGASF